ncbi:pyruvate formate-lyase-activating protein [Tetragenococcus muriaticus]|uniref:Pyruvate formate-lyase-activating enzyme n=2 Tax=Tetragenococcus muriaticus TaxID=64642 RepID=A0A091C3P6_9ENTE|nr:pyruvate formate-lyase-activating protein [Tetragenococcus muriaticus]KFN90717.1 pyruvate formate-lyase activating enzyme [Tetragenococcus muriaticus 3MR10-3]GMA46991.1 pyruvate formate-lyase-activating enzyme [Tetragenococcus muriaticus]
MTDPVMGRIHSTENFGTVDGPGVRFIVFAQGCRMRCEFCHNPDTWNIKSKKAKMRTADDILEEAVKYRPYWGEKGGITVSGGEPLLQIDFLIDLFKKAKAQGIHTTLDTCGNPFTRKEPFFSKFEELMNYTDLLLFDIKHIDTVQHKKLTKHGNENILEMAQYLSEIGKPVWIRHVLVPFRSDYDEFLDRLNQFIQSLSNVDKVEILPYHTMGRYKWDELNIKYPLEGIEPPGQDRVENAKKILQVDQYTGYQTR